MAIRQLWQTSNGELWLNKNKAIDREAEYLLKCGIAKFIAKQDKTFCYDKKITDTIAQAIVKFFNIDILTNELTVKVKYKEDWNELATLPFFSDSIPKNPTVDENQPAPRSTDESVD